LVEKGVQALEISLPESPVTLEPHFELLERGGPQRIDAALCVHAHFHEASIVQDAEVLGDLRLTEAEAPDEVADGAGPGAQEFDDMKAVGLAQSAEGSHHTGDEYASKHIFVSRNILLKEYTN
jgi:hypothetical protein